MKLTWLGDVEGAGVLLGRGVAEADPEENL